MGWIDTFYQEKNKNLFIKVVICGYFHLHVNFFIGIEFAIDIKN